MDQKEILRGMLQDVINDKMDQATVSMHDYFVAKMRQVSGSGMEDESVDADEAIEETTDESVETE